MVQQPADPKTTDLLRRYERRFSSGEVIFQEGQPATVAYLLQEGRVRVIKRVGAVERGLRILRPGDLFGETALIAGTRRNVTTVALGEVSTLALDSDAFTQLIASSPAKGMAIVRQLIERTQEAEEQIHIFMVRDAQSKIVLALSKAAQRAQRGNGSADGVTLAISPMELSAIVGLDVDTVKRNVQVLRDNDYVRIVDEMIEVPDMDALRELTSLLDVRDQLVGGDS